MKKLLLVNPVGQSSGYLLSKFSTIPPLSLAYIAAATPSDWEIKIADENFSRLVFEDADLVGISAFTSNINRAYEIAGIYRKQGIKVVIGGIHASMLPDEALQYADAVVVGEAELIWKKVLEDYDNNRLRGKYSGPRVDLSQSTIKPRRD
ncbi:MAG: cobalamin-dependent protein, partial [Desulfobacterales bacterium]